jgi:hypothetical protein
MGMVIVKKKLLNGIISFLLLFLLKKLEFQDFPALLVIVAYYLVKILLSGIIFPFNNIYCCLMKSFYKVCNKNNFKFVLRYFFTISTLLFLSEQTYAQTCLIDNSTAWSGSYTTTSGYCSSSYKYAFNGSFFKDLTIPSGTASFKFDFKFGTHNYTSNSSLITIEAPIGTVVATYNPVTGDIVDTNGGCLQARTLSANNPSGNTTIRVTVTGDDNYAKVEPICFSICNLSATKLRTNDWKYFYNKSFGGNYLSI